MKTLNFNSREFCKGISKEYKIGIFGSRSLSDERVLTIILEKITEKKATKILTCQEPGGVSEVAQKVCKGTANELKLIVKSGKPYHYEVLEISKYTKSVGFNVVNDWNEKTVVKEWFEDDN